MSAEENKAVVRREVEELYNYTGNLDAVEEIFSPDYVSHEPTSGEVRGIEGARQFAATFREAFPDLQNTIEDMIAEGEKVSARFTMRGTHKGDLRSIAPSGREVTMTGIDMIRLEEGKMVEDRVEVDQLGMMQQLGAIASPQHAEA